jgi:hypothetical protein
MACGSFLLTGGPFLNGASKLMAYISRTDGLPPIPPLRWTDPDAMQERIDAYFTECAEREEPATVTGLALALDFVNRNGLLRYEAGEVGGLTLDETTRRALQHTVKRAKSRIEAQREVALYQGKVNPIGTIFSLKNNFGWIDRQETTGPNVTIQIASFDPSQTIISNVMGRQAIEAQSVALTEVFTPQSVTIDQGRVKVDNEGE